MTRKRKRKWRGLKDAENRNGSRFSSMEEAVGRRSGREWRHGGGKGLKEAEDDGRGVGRKA